MIDIYTDTDGYAALAMDVAAARVVVAALLDAGYSETSIYAEIDGQYYMQARYHLLLPSQVETTINLREQSNVLICDVVGRYLIMRAIAQFCGVDHRISAVRGGNL
jgi:hypothetical protein